MIARMKTSCHTIAAATIVACTPGGDRGAPSVDVRDSAGVTIVNNRYRPADTVRVSAPIMQIGSTDMDAEDPYVFELVSDVAVFADGRIFVVDNRGARVAVFARAGAWLLDIGREGAGPGEHRGPIRIGFNADTVLIWDAIQRKLNRFTVNGEYLGSMVVAERNAAVPLVPVPGGYIDEVEWGQHMDPAPARGAIVMRARDGTITDTILGPFPVPDIGWQWTDDSQRAGMMVNPPVFSVRPVWAVHARELFWSILESGEIQVHNAADGTLRRIIRTGQTAIATTAQDREAQVDAAISRFNIDPARRAAILESTAFAPVRPPFATFLIDDRGWIWLADHDPKHLERHHLGSTWNVLDRDGALRKTYHFPDTFELRVIRNSRAFGITRDVDGVEVIEVFDISRANSGIDQ